MILTKNISYGEIDVNPDEGKIWINCPNCILRIQNIRFNKIEEKFSMIEINGNEAWMMQGSFSEDPLSIFIEKLIPILLEKFKSSDEIQLFLDNLLMKIRKDE
jgi:hypothetical protein